MILKWTLAWNHILNDRFQVPKLPQEKVHQHLKVFNKNLPRIKAFELTRTQKYFPYASNQYSTWKQHQDSSKNTRKLTEIYLELFKGFLGKAWVYIAVYSKKRRKQGVCIATECSGMGIGPRESGAGRFTWTGLRESI
jgi:hypothetical protein